MTNPFDAAIERLRRSETQGCEPDIEAAIRVLEAAGKVDKNNCLDYLHHTGAILTLSEVEAYAGKWNAAEQTSEYQIHSLLAALPENVPAPSPGPTIKKDLTVEVEEAMGKIENLLGGFGPNVFRDEFGRRIHYPRDTMAALAVIRAALTKP